MIPRTIVGQCTKCHRISKREVGCADIALPSLCPYCGGELEKLKTVTQSSNSSQGKIYAKISHFVKKLF